MVTHMHIHQHVGHAGLQGWREKVADVVAPPAAKHGPADEDQVRAFIGGAFFVLSLYYVVVTIVKAVQSARD
jgi:hypothetical protein